MSNRHNERKRHKRNLKKAAETVWTTQNHTERTHTPKPTPSKRLDHQGRITEYLRQHIAWMWAAIGIFLALFGGMAGAYSLRPLIAVTAAPSLNKGAPYEPLFTITNDGLTEDYDLRFACYGLQQVYVEKSIINPHLTIENHQTDEPGNNILPEQVLKPQVPIARTCALSIQEWENTHSVWFAVTLLIEYRPSFWPWHVVKLASFKSRIDTSGQIQWIPDPKENPFGRVPPLPPRKPSHS
jgi:hypothetical protein